MHRMDRAICYGFEQPKLDDPDNEGHAPVQFHTTYRSRPLGLCDMCVGKVLAKMRPGEELKLIKS